MKPEDLRDRLEPRWSDERADAVLSGIPARARARARRRAIAGGLVALVLMISAFTLRPEADVEISVQIPKTAWREVTRTASLQEYAVDEGAVWFSVTPGKARVVRVRCGNTEVEVIGTRFLVARIDGGARVTVDHGRVRVTSSRGIRELTDGQSAEFVDDVPSVSPVPAPEIVVDAGAPLVMSKPRVISTVPVVAAKPRWQDLAATGDYDAAWDELEQGGAPSDDVGDLLLAADVARLSKHAPRAVVFLRRVVDDHAADARAPLAAFTLGRVLLDDLGQPREAAAAFADCPRLNPDTPLAEDALARQVDAWQRAGDLVRARSTAVEFERRYPTSPRLRVVRRLGGLE